MRPPRPPSPALAPRLARPGRGARRVRRDRGGGGELGGVRLHVDRVWSLEEIMVTFDLDGDGIA